jgi:hypothetical protein
MLMDPYELDSKYRGVAGWLLVLCIFLTVLDPFAMLLSAFVTVDQAKPDALAQPQAFNFIIITGVLKLALAVFSMYAGFLLWRVQPKAIRTVLIYFRTIFLYSVIAVVLPNLLGVPKKMLKELTEANLLNCVSVFLFYIVLWPLYLRRSKRVRATYGGKIITTESETQQDE